MRRPLLACTSLLAFVAGFSLPSTAQADAAGLEAAVADLAEPLMREHAVPGLAVAVVAAGERAVFTFGVTEQDGDLPVSERTIFEIGSLSKPFTATLAAYAESTGALRLEDAAQTRMPEIEGTAAGEARLLDLATYAAGGLPLQFPDPVRDQDGMIAFFRDWTPSAEPGSTRLYSNPSIGLFGHIAARSMGGTFSEAMEGELFPAFGLESTFLQVPAERTGDYAFGMTRDGRTVRVTPGMFDAEAYGIKTTAGDMALFLEAQLDPSPLSDDWQAAVRATQTPRYRVGAMHQGLGWELYRWPVSGGDILTGNSTTMALEPHPVEPLGDPVEGPMLVNKTGSTGGFGAYALLLPSEGVAVAMLANRNFPNEARIAFAQSILSHLVDAD